MVGIGITSPFDHLDTMSCSLGHFLPSGKSSNASDLFLNYFDKTKHL